MAELFPNLLRAIVTDIMLIHLLCTMATPKYKSKWVYTLVTVAVLTINLAVNVVFYLSEDYTAVLVSDMVLLAILAFALKPLFTSKMMQWFFSYLTMLNIYAAVVFLSYILSDFFPHPMYANSFLRLLFFAAVVIVFQKWVSELYRRVLDYWHVYFLPVLALFACFFCCFFGGDVVQMLENNALLLILLTTLGLSIYIAIIHSLKTLTEQYTMREENLQLQSNEQLLRQAAVDMAGRIRLMDDLAKQLSIINHDRRHFNSTMRELLEAGEIEQALQVLRKEQGATLKPTKCYCENPICNAAISHQATLAHAAHITCDFRVQIPADLEMDSLELSLVLSNLLENGITACESLPSDKAKTLQLTVMCDIQLIVELKNSYRGEIQWDENGCPTSPKAGHGVGTKSVFAFVERYGGDVVYQAANGVFSVRLLCGNHVKHRLR